MLAEYIYICIYFCRIINIANNIYIYQYIYVCVYIYGSESLPPKLSILTNPAERPESGRRLPETAKEDPRANETLL